MNKTKEVFKRIVYILKLTLPLTYSHSFSVDNDRVITIWKRWFNKIYDYQVILLKKYSSDCDG